MNQCKVSMSCPIQTDQKLDEVRSPEHNSIELKKTNETIPNVSESNKDHQKLSFNHIIGNFIWYPDEDDVWVKGEVQSMTNDTVFVKTTHNDIKAFLFEKTVPVGEDYDCEEMNDLAELDNMHEAPLLDILKNRYDKDLIYTYTGDILISINPYFNIPKLYDITEENNQLEEKQNVCDNQKPHIFQVAEKALQLLLEKGVHQSIIISGESGAGKTEAAKLIMKYLAFQSSKCPFDSFSLDINNESHIEQTVLESNFLLEAFGNASTIRNFNSSRFGKFVKLKYNKNGKIIGTQTEHFLLEKSRVTKLEHDERNYHVFYQMCNGLSKHLRDVYRIDNAKDYKFLNQGDRIALDHVDDKSNFTLLQNAMTSININEEQQKNVFSVLAAILHLGNVCFFDNVDITSTSIVIDERMMRSSSLEHVASLLGFELDLLEKALTSRTTLTGRGSIYNIPLTSLQAEEARDAFCKSIYEQLFCWLINCINNINQCKKDESSFDDVIGILDIFGFEILQTNSLEQLCINYANEALQQQFNHHVFELEQAQYVQEGIDWTMIEFLNNQPILDLIDHKPSGILVILEDRALLGHQHAENITFLDKLHRAHLQNAHYGRPKIISESFIIHHFAGSVQYDTSRFIEKNNDTLHADLVLLMQRSTNKFIKELFSLSEQAGSKRVGLMGKNTVTSVFKSQLKNLMQTLTATTPHYVRCIKPNNQGSIHKFNAKIVLTQLRYSGVMEVVRIRRQGYPVRREFNQFFNKYKQLVENHQQYDDQLAIKDKCAFICRHALKSETHQIGKSQIYLRDRQVQELDTLLRQQLNEAVRMIQRSALAYLSRCRCQRFQEEVKLKNLKSIEIQRCLRGHKCRKAFKRYRYAAVLIQAHFRRMRHQLLYEATIEAAIVIQARVRQYLIVKRYKNAQNAVLTVQSALRRYLSNRIFTEEMNEIKAAILAGDAQRVRGMLRENTKLRNVRYREDHMKTHMHFATLSASIATMSMVLEHSLHNCSSLIYARDALGNFPIHVGAQKRNLQVLRYLTSMANNLCPIENSSSFNLDCRSQELTCKDSLFTFQEANSVKKGWVNKVLNPIKSRFYQNGIDRVTSTKSNLWIQGWLWKKRTHNRWRKRFVVVNDEDMWYSKGKSSKPSLKFSLKNTMVKKCAKIPNCFEVHSPELLNQRNKEGRLYFSANNEVDLQNWLQHLRQVINQKIDHTLRVSPVKYVNSSDRKKLLNTKNNAGETPLHIVCKESTVLNIENRLSISDGLLCAMWLIANGAEIQETILDHGIDVTPIILAIKKGNIDLAVFLYSTGAEISSNMPFYFSEIEKVYWDTFHRKITDKNITDVLQSGLFRKRSQSQTGAFITLYFEQLVMKKDDKICSTNILNNSDTITVRIHVLNKSNNLVETLQEKKVVVFMYKDRKQEVILGTTWEMQTALENLSPETRIGIELTSMNGEVNIWGVIQINEKDIDTSFFEIPLYKAPFNPFGKVLRSSGVQLTGERYLQRM